MDRPKHYYSQHHIGRWGRQHALSLVHGVQGVQPFRCLFVIDDCAAVASDNSYTRAQAYYMQQLPEFRKAAQKFQLHPAFVDLPIPATVTFYDMVCSAQRVSVPCGVILGVLGTQVLLMSIMLQVSARFKHMLENYNQYKWDDWKIEKNKCTAVSFLANNSFPHSKAIGEAFTHCLPESLNLHYLLLCAPLSAAVCSTICCCVLHYVLRSEGQLNLLGSICCGSESGMLA